jgi:hypothetical protein
VFGKHFLPCFSRFLRTKIFISLFDVRKKLAFYCPAPGLSGKMREERQRQSWGVVEEEGWWWKRRVVVGRVPKKWHGACGGMEVRS